MPVSVGLAYHHPLQYVGEASEYSGSEASGDLLRVSAMRIEAEALATTPR